MEVPATPSPTGSAGAPRVWPVGRSTGAVPPCCAYFVAWAREPTWGRPPARCRRGGVAAAARRCRPASRVAHGAGLGRGARRRVRGERAVGGVAQGRWMTMLLRPGSCATRAAEAMALHQLGTRALCLADLPTALDLLGAALAIREAPRRRARGGRHEAQPVADHCAATPAFVHRAAPRPAPAWWKAPRTAVTSAAIVAALVGAGLCGLPAGDLARTRSLASRDRVPAQGGVVRCPADLPTRSSHNR